MKEIIDNLKEEIEAIRQKEDVIEFDINDIASVKQKLSYMVKIDGLAKDALIPYWDEHYNEINEFLTHISQANTETLKEILSVHNWINISKFGEQADFDAWLIVQLSDDFEFRTDVLHKLEELKDINETNILHYAILYDRVQIEHYQNGEIDAMQKYGSQFIPKNGIIILAPFEGSLEELNQRRLEIGLNSIEDYIKDLEEYSGKKLYIYEEDAFINSSIDSSPESMNIELLGEIADFSNEI